MRDNARGAKRLSHVVEIDAPRIARAFRENFEDLFLRVISPNASVDGNAFFIRRARLADARVREDAVTSVQPTVRPPVERVQSLVGVLICEAIEQNLWRAVRFVVMIF